MKLKDSQIYRKAFEHSLKQDFGEMDIVFQTLAYLCRLYQLDQKAINIKFPDLDDHDTGTRLSYLWPYDPDKGKEQDLLPDMIEIKQHPVHSQQSAAKLCGVSERTLQRWTKKKGGLRSFKHGKQRIYLETDLEEAKIKAILNSI